MSSLECASTVWPMPNICPLSTDHSSRDKTEWSETPNKLDKWQSNQLCRWWKYEFLPLNSIYWTFGSYFTLSQWQFARHTQKMVNTTLIKEMQSLQEKLAAMLCIELTAAGMILILLVLTACGMTTLVTRMDTGIGMLSNLIRALRTVSNFRN